MITTQFSPNANTPFQFQATLNGPTPNVTATGNTFNVTILWNTAGQRWYVKVTDQSNDLVVNKPLISSDANYPISLVAGYFTSTLAYYGNAQTFVVTP